MRTRKRKMTTEEVVDLAKDMALEMLGRCDSKYGRLDTSCSMDNYLDPYFEQPCNRIYGDGILFEMGCDDDQTAAVVRELMPDNHIRRPDGTGTIFRFLAADIENLNLISTAKCLAYFAAMPEGG